MKERETREKSPMELWAEKEIEIAIEREKADDEADEPSYMSSEYGVMCYKSALKAYKSLCEDGHSGMSIGFTRQILNRLLDHKVLTPIVDTDDIWKKSFTQNGATSYQCERMTSVFKNVEPDGTVTYDDVSRVVCHDIQMSHVPYHSGLADRVINELFPIKMPYIPEDGEYKVFCNQCLANPENGGDFDTIWIMHAITPSGEQVMINRYFKEDDDTKPFVEIDVNEFLKRLGKAMRRGKENRGQNEIHSETKQ